MFLIVSSGGKGWETSLGHTAILQQIQNTGGGTPRKDTKEERRRSQAGAPVPPSPALVRHGSKQLNIPAALTPGGPSGQVTPLSAAAQVNVPVNQRGASQQHPYANLAAGGYEYRPEGDDSYVGQEAYGRTSAMVSSVGAAAPAISQVRARAGDIGVANEGAPDGLADSERRGGFSFFKFMTCRNC